MAGVTLRVFSRSEPRRDRPIEFASDCFDVLLGGAESEREGERATRGVCCFRSINMATPRTSHIVYGPRVFSCGASLCAPRHLGGFRESVSGRPNYDARHSIRAREGMLWFPRFNIYIKRETFLTGTRPYRFQSASISRSVVPLTATLAERHYISNSITTGVFWMLILGARRSSFVFSPGEQSRRLERVVAEWA